MTIREIGFSAFLIVSFCALEDCKGKETYFDREPDASSTSGDSQNDEDKGSVDRSAYRAITREEVHAYLDATGLAAAREQIDELSLVADAMTTPMSTPVATSIPTTIATQTATPIPTLPPKATTIPSCGATGPWSFDIGNALFTNLYDQYYDAAVKAYCSSHRLTPAQCVEFKMNQSYRRTIPYYHPNSGYLVAQAQAQIQSSQASLRNLLGGMRLSLVYGPGDIATEADSLLQHIAGERKVLFVSTEAYNTWAAKPENASVVAKLATAGGGSGCFTAVYTPSCYTAMGYTEATAWNAAVQLVLRNLNSQCATMRNNIMTLPPNAPSTPSCVDDAWCEAQPELPSVDAWTNARCEYNSNFFEMRCKSYSILNGDCPGPGSTMFAYPCDRGLKCMVVQSKSICRPIR